MKTKSLVSLAALAALLWTASDARAGTVYSDAVQNEANLLRYWNFEDTSSGNVVEKKAGVNNLVPTTTASGQSATLVTHASLPGDNLQLGSAALLSGGGRFIASTLDVSSGPSSFGIEFWMKPTTAVNPQGFIASFNGDNPAVTYGFAGATPANAVSFYMGSGTWPLTNNFAVTDTNWHYFLFLVDGSTHAVTAYMDGTSRTLTNTLGTFNMGGIFTVGANSSGVWGYNGYVDELALYDFTGMSGAQIAARGSELAGHYMLAGAVSAATITSQFLSAASGPGSSWSDFTAFGGPSASDYADSHSGHGVVFTKVGGNTHGVSGPSTVLNDGDFPDTYNASTLYLAEDNEPLRVLINLTQPSGPLLGVNEVRTFDFPVEKRRDYQSYALYGSAAASAPSTSGSTSTELLAAGWTLIANVNAFGPDYSTSTTTSYLKGGVSISGINQAYRFLLWDIPTMTAGSEYAEFDIYGASVPEPSTLVLLLFGLAAAPSLAWRRRRASARGCVVRGNGPDNNAPIAVGGP